MTCVVEAYVFMNKGGNCFQRNCCAASVGEYSGVIKCHQLS